MKRANKNLHTHRQMHASASAQWVECPCGCLYRVQNARLGFIFSVQCSDGALL